MSGETKTLPQELKSGRDHRNTERENVAGLLGIGVKFLQVLVLAPAPIKGITLTAE